MPIPVRLKSPMVLETYFYLIREARTQKVEKDTVVLVPEETANKWSEKGKVELLENYDYNEQLLVERAIPLDLWEEL